MTLKLFNIKKIKPYILCILACIIVQISSSLITIPSVTNWYRTLVKPSFTPPDWVFGPVWSLLYLMMGFAWGHINAVSANKAKVRNANILFATQLVFNGLWSFIYFGAHSVGFALLDITLLWITLILTNHRFFGISKLAGWLLVPYLLWTSYAFTLNASIWYLNK
jgi:benzodiazapine receptor